MLHFLFTLVTLFVTHTIAQEFDTHRLPNNTRPETYEISIRTWVHDDNATFTGSVRIGIVAVESTNFIRLHHNVERLESLRVLSVNEEPVSIGDYSYSSQFEFLTIPIVGSNLTQGTRYFIEIDYVGTMNTYSGFYRSVYDVNGTRVWFATTHFEATYARTAFPCWDEPGRRSNFTIRLTHDSSYSAISNMPVASETSNPDGSVTTEFETTPLIPAFLIAFHISRFPYVTSSTPTPTSSSSSLSIRPQFSRFPYVTSSTPTPIPQRIFTRSDVINSTQLALEVSGLLFEALSDYVGIEYSLPKLDHVAVPGFASGAMSNLGLISYPEFFSLFDEETDFFTRHIEVLKTISREISHQWFGNLVTPSWWTFLWLKDGFGTFFEYQGVDLIYPEWQMIDYFLVDITHNVFYVDSDEYAQPMTYYVERPIDIDFEFISIASEKGAAVLRMFFYIFGETVFMRGVTSYLEENANSDAGEEQLFDALDESVRLETGIIPPTTDVPTIMSTWSRQAGFPLITVDRNYDDRTDQVTLRQQRFYSFPPPTPTNTTWWVPFNLITPSNPGFENTLADGWIPQNTYSLEITVDSLGADDYLLINKRAAGYYRVMYDERNYRLISDGILRNSSLFHSTSIAQLISDAYEFYRTNNQVTLPTILDLVRVLEFQTDYVSWIRAFVPIYHIDRNFQGHRNYPIWADFVRSLTEELYDSIGVEDIPGEPILNKFARESVVNLACQMGSVHCRSDANRQLRLHIETGQEFHYNIRHVLMCASFRSASRTELNFMLNRLMLLPLDAFTERSEIVEWLGCSQSRPLLREFISTSLDSTNSRGVEYSDFEKYSVFNSIVRNAGNVGLELALDFLNENAVEAFHTYGGWFIQSLAFIIGNAGHIERYVSFQNILLDAGLMIQGEFNFNMEVVAENVQWLDTEGEVVNTWLMDNFA